MRSAARLQLGPQVGQPVGEDPGGHAEDVLLGQLERAARADNGGMVLGHLPSDGRTTTATRAAPL